MLIRKFHKNDTKQVADLIYETFQKFNGREYFEKGVIRRYLDQYDTKKNAIEKLNEAFSKSPLFFVAVEEPGSSA